MKKFYVLFFAFVLISISSMAQVATYTFSQASNTFDSLVGGRQLGTTTTASGFYFTDSTAAAGSATVNTGIGLPIGFNFIYNGTTFNVFGVNSNGFITFGQSSLTPSVNLQTTTLATPISSASTAPAALQNRVVAFGRGLIAQATSKLSYAKLGVAPNRTLVVEWRNFKRTTTGAVDTLNFQIRLHETTNVVECVYGKMKFNSASTNIELGLRGSANTDYNNRTTTTNWATTTAGAVNTATMAVSATIFPAVGLTYVWSPPITYQFDAGLTAINAPVTPVTLGANNVTVTIKNFGSDSLKTASIAWKVNNVLQTPYAFINVGLPLLGTQGPIIIGSYNFTTAGMYVIKAWSETPNGNADANHTNDTVTKTVYAQGYAPIPFGESFNNTWLNIMNTRDVPSVYWVNTPATGNSSWRRDEDGAAAVWTGAAGAYTPAGVGTGTLHSARFHSSSATVGAAGTLDAYINFSTVGTKMLKFWNINTSGTDTLSVQMSSDAGLTYTTVQKFAVAAAWTQRLVPLGASVSPQTIVRFRVANVAAGGTTDIGLDSVQVVILTPDDAGISAINAPVSPILQGTNPVTVTVKNYGSANLTAASIGWSVNSVVQTPFPYTNVGLASNATDGPITIGSFNFLTPGNNIIKTWTSMPNGNTDGDHSNDTLTKTVYVQGFAPIPFGESFNNTWINVANTRDVPSMYWVNTPNTGNSSWRRDEDGAAAAWTTPANGVYAPVGVGTGTLHSARFHSRYATVGAAGTMDAYVNLSPVGTKMLKFWNINTSGTDTLSVMMSNDAGTTYTTLQKFAITPTWTQRLVPLGTSVAPQTIVRFRVNNTATGGTTDVGLDSVQVVLLSPNDAGITAINAPTTPVIQGTNPVTVTVKNYGSDNLTAASIGWSVNAVGQTASPYSNVGLVTNATDGPITIGNYNFAAAGNYTIKTWTSMPNGSTDGDNTNDTLSKIVYVQPYAPIPFFEGFDSLWINKNATRDVPSNFWANIPATGNNSWRRNEDTLSAPWTNVAGGANGSYSPKGANGSIHSARFHTWDAASGTAGDMDLFVNMSLPGSKLLDFWNINVDGTDSLSVYLSTNGGASFTFLQKFLTATTWTHNIFSIGNSTSPNCIVRFKTVSDYGNTDIAIDQVQIYLSPDNDVSAVRWLAPLSGCGLTNAEHVTVKVANHGIVAQTNVPVKYSIDGGLSYVGPETIPGTILPGDTVTYTFTAASDFSTAGMYNCQLVTQLASDAFPLNDSLFMDVEASHVISSIPFMEDFNTGNSNYLMLAANTDSYVNYEDLIGTTNTYGLHFTGKTATGWPSGNTTATSAYSFANHLASAVTCGVNASSVSSLFLRFDLLQTYSARQTYSYFAAVINNTDTIADDLGTKYFNATSASSDVYATKYFNLSAYAGSNFSIKFISACKYDDANYTTTNIGDNVYFDNMSLYVPPTMNDLGADTSICQGSTITFNAGAGTGYTYLWTAIPSGNVLGTAQTLTVDTTGTYHVVVTNPLGYSATDLVHVTTIPAPAAFAGNDTTITYLAAANLHGSVTSGVGPFTYSWSPADSLVDATLQNPVTTCLHYSTIYTVTVTNTLTGCVGTDQVVVFITGGPLSVSAMVNTDTICEGDPISLSALPSGGSGNYTYSWTSTPAGFIAAVADTVAYPTANTTYHISINDGTNTATSSIAVVVHALPVVSLGNDTTVCSTSHITLIAGAAASYLWSTGATTQTIIVDSTFASGGVAAISVTATSFYGCTKTDAINITFVSCAGINEYGDASTIAVYPNPSTGIFNVVVNGLNKSAELVVYNLQGQAVFTKTISGDINTKLDLSDMPKGVYFVRIRNEEISHISKLIIQ